MASHDVTVRWRSFELRPAGSPPMPAAYRAKIEAGRPQFNQMARDKYGLEMNGGPFGIDSRPALIGAKYAEAQGEGEAYHRAVFAAYWQQARDIGDLTVLAEIAEAAGLAREPFLAALHEPQFEAAVTADVNLARQYQLNGVPAMIFANKYLVSGAQPYEVLVQVVEQILAE